MEDLYKLSHEEEQKLIEIFSNPIKWAENTLCLKDKPLELRWYQKEILNHAISGEDTSNRLVLRCGRRTGKTTTLAVLALWHCFTTKNGKIVVVAPYDRHVEVVFKMFREFINDSPELHDSIERDIKNPQYIEFKNGATIAGFTSGVKSGDKGDSVRGQAADWIILDEMDRMHSDDIDSIVSIAAEDADRIGIAASSTPTGKRDKFYEWCYSSIWKEFHFASHVNPNWNETAEQHFRDILSEQGYVHEVLAEFGSETVGVFNKDYIDMSREDYYYEESASELDTVCIGVDWDKYQAATQIIVLKFDKGFQDKYGITKPRFRVLNRVEIERSEFTFDNAVKKIIKLNKQYNPNFIYVDKGSGEYQIETLRKYGEKYPETGLYNKVKGIQFAEKLEIRDPVTKELEKKPIKPFMVNQTSIILERHQLALSDYDQELWKQMEDYRVVRKTTAGVPVYTDENEHALDALMLAVLAFSLEYPNLTKVLQQFHVARKMAKAPRIDNLAGSGGYIGDKSDKKNAEEDMFDPEDPDEKSGMLIKKGNKKDPSRSGRAATMGTWGPRRRGSRSAPKRRW